MADPLWTEAATVQLIATIGVVLAAAIPAWRKLQGMGRDISVTRDHVANDHDTNLRDDVDTAIRVSTENRQWIGALAVEVRHLREAVERDRRPRWWPSRRGSGHRT